MEHHWWWHLSNNTLHKKWKGGKYNLLQLGNLVHCEFDRDDLSQGQCRRLQKCDLQNMKICFTKI